MSKEITLYFGRNIKDEHGVRKIEEAQFWQFINQYITPVFGSFTILPGVGVWKTYAEPCTVLIINTDTYYDGDAQKIREICNNYCNMFNQECVMVTYKDVETKLIGKE